MNKLSKKILVQHLVIEWDKSFRGGANAAKRNSLREEYLLPKEIITQKSNQQIPIHMIRFSSNNLFEKPSFERILYEKVKSDKVKHSCITLKIKQNNIDVYFEYNSQCGAPPRYMYNYESKKKVPLKEKAFTLNPNEFGKVIINGRFSDADTGNWRYKKHIFNIIYTDTLNMNSFKNKTVSKMYSKLAKMW